MSWVRSICQKNDCTIPNMPPKNKNTILNPATGRQVLKSGTIGRRLVANLKDPQKPLNGKKSNLSGRRGPKRSPSDSSEYSSASQSSDSESDQSSERKSDGQTTEGESDFTENDSANDESDETSDNNNNNSADDHFDENEQSADDEMEDEMEDDIEDDVLIKPYLDTKDISLSGRLKPINPAKRTPQPGLSVAPKKRLIS